jgi:hypothetical protein
MQQSSDSEPGNPSIPVQKTKENLLVMMRSCMKKLCFFLQTGISLPGLVVVLVVGSVLFSGC